MTKFIFELSYDNNTQEIKPFGEITLNYEKDDGTEYFEKIIQSFTVVNKDDYDFIKEIELSGDNCGEILINIYKSCNGENILEFEGNFSIVDCSFDDNACVIVINPQPKTPYNCLKESDKKDVNLLAETDAQSIQSDYENNIFLYNASGIENVLRVPKGDPPPTADLLTDYVPEDEIPFIKIQKLDPDSGITHNHYVAWQYRKAIPKTGSTCEQTLSGGYSLLGSNPTTCFYQKKPADVDNLNINRTNVCSPGAGGPGTIDIYVGVWGDETAIGPLCVWYTPYTGANGRARRLEDCLNALLSGCDFNGVKSDYFQINPTNPATINYVTNEPTKTNNIFLIQKSDAIFWQSSEVASIQKSNFTDFMDGLKSIFNVGWTVKDNFLIIEHVSFFENASSLIDLTIGKYKSQIEGKKKYSYKKELLPYIEEIKQSDYANEDFEPSEIIYEDPNGDKLKCVGTEKKEYNFGIFFTDLQYYQEVPTDVSLDGWVIVACNTDPTPYVHNEVGLKSGSNQINGHLAITNLVNRYYLSGRSSNIGKIDGVDKAFSSSVKIKISDGFDIIECCDSNITPDNSIKDNIGIGEIVELSKDLKINKTTIKLEY